MISSIPLLRRILPVVVLLLIFSEGRAQNDVPNYRFQYHEYKWKAFHIPAFHVYFPGGYDSACAYVSLKIPGAMALIRKRMATSLQQVPSIIIYPSTDQLYESNIGSSDLKSVTLPTFIAKGTRILLAYNGSYKDLEDQMHEALVTAIWEGQLSERLEAQATGQTNGGAVPYWMKQGTIRYFAHGWPLQAEDALLNLIETTHVATWEAVIAQRPSLAGQALNYYLAVKYYPEAPMQLYFLLRKRKPLPRALRLITKTETDSVYADCLRFYRERLHPGLNVRKDSSIASAKTVSLSHAKGNILSMVADQQQTSIAYVVSGWHRRTVYVYDLPTRQTTLITRYALPPWINDHSSDPYPLLTWNDGRELLITLPVKGKINIRKYDHSGHLRAAYELENVDGISTVKATDNGNEYLLAAWRKGQSDVVSYNLQKDKYIPLTYDQYDDAQPSLDKSTGSVLFVSERPLSNDKKDTIKKQGIFTYHDKEMHPFITDSNSYINWTEPVFLNNGKALAVTTENGFSQFVLVNNLLQPGSSNTLLGARTPVQYLSSTNEVLTFTTTRDSLFVAKQPLAEWTRSQQATTNNKSSPWLVDYKNAAAARAKEDSILKAAIDPAPSFLDGVLSGGNARKQGRERQDSLQRALRYDPKKIEPYTLQLYSAYFTARINNDYLINRYQPFLNYQGQFKFPATGGLAQGGFSDLFENHHFTIAYRLPAGSEGSDFFVRYKNTIRKTNWGLAYYRKAEDNKPDPLRNWVNENGRQYPNAAKVKTNYYEVSVQRPLSFFSAVDMSLAFRQDKTVFLATERYSLDFPPIKSLWAILTLSYSLNKLQPTLPLLYKGFTGGVNLDVFKGFTQRQDALAGMGIHMAWHKPLYRYISLVIQAKAGYSAGDHRVLYNLGGVDNNINPRIDSTVHFAQDAPYAFQTLVTPFRGYLQNSLYGSQYALLNMDVYFPLFQSLIPIETPLSSLNNLQLGVFTDVAGAGGNRIYTNAAKGPLASYGVSARTTLAGYPLRFDLAWPGSFSKQPVWYLSLNVH